VTTFGARCWNRTGMTTFGDYYIESLMMIYGRERSESERLPDMIRSGMRNLPLTAKFLVKLRNGEKEGVGIWFCWMAEGRRRRTW